MKSLSLVQAGKEECQDTGMKITAVLKKKAEDGSLPECGQNDAFKNMIMCHGTEEEEECKKAFNEMYGKAEEDEKKEIKECLVTIMKMGAEEVEDMPEDCKELMDKFCNELTKES